MSNGVERLLVNIWNDGGGVRAPAGRRRSECVPAGIAGTVPNAAPGIGAGQSRRSAPGRWIERRQVDVQRVAPDGVLMLLMVMLDERVVGEGLQLGTSRRQVDRLWPPSRGSSTAQELDDAGELRHRAVEAGGARQRPSCSSRSARAGDGRDRQRPRGPADFHCAVSKVYVSVGRSNVSFAMSELMSPQPPRRPRRRDRRRRAP